MKFFIILFFITAPSWGLSQVTGPIDFDLAGRELANWFVLGTSHEPIVSSNPTGRMWGTYSDRPSWSENYSSELAVSVLALPIDDRVKSAFQAFDIDTERLPDNLYFPRIHYLHALSRSTALGLSGLYNSEIQMYGAGVNIATSLFSLGPFHTGFSAHYGQSWKTGFMNTQTWGGSIIETFSYRRLDLFFGLNYTGGQASFTPDPDEDPFPKISTNSEFGKSFLTGISYLVLRDLWFFSESMIFTLQANVEEGHKTFWIAKLTLKIPSYRTREKDLAKN